MDVELTIDQKTVIFRGVSYTKGTEKYIDMVFDVTRELFTLDDYEAQLNADYGNVEICGTEDYGQGTILRKMIGEENFDMEYSEILGNRALMYARSPLDFYRFVQRC